MAPDESSPYRLVVEGRDDCFSVINLLARHGYRWDDDGQVRPYVAPAGGVDEVLEQLPVLLKGTYQRVGVVVDANSSITGRWQALRNRIATLVNLPDEPPPEGVVIPGRRTGTLVGFWLMPDNTRAGYLEDFLATLVPDDDPVWRFAGEATSESRARGARCRDVDHSKSQVYTWLAWQECPGHPFGTAIKAGVFRHDSAEATNFVGWFRRLFGSS